MKDKPDPSPVDTLWGILCNAVRAFGGSKKLSERVIDLYLTRSHSCQKLLTSTEMPSFTHDQVLPCIGGTCRGLRSCLGSMGWLSRASSDLRSLPIHNHRWNELSMDFVTGLPIFTDWKGDIYDLVLAIVGRLTKILHHEPVHTTIDASGFAEPILDKRQVTEEKKPQINEQKTKEREVSRLDCWKYSHAVSAENFTLYLLPKLLPKLLPRRSPKLLPK